MKITKKLVGTALTIAVEGRLDTTSAPELETELASSLNEITELSFDFAGLEYISSAGLRVLLSAQKTLVSKATVIILNANDDIKEIFDVTGFADILDIR